MLEVPSLLLFFLTLPSCCGLQIDCCHRLRNCCLLGRCGLPTGLLSMLNCRLESLLVLDFDSDLSEQVSVFREQVLNHAVQAFLDGHVHFDDLAFSALLFQVDRERVSMSFEQTFLESFGLLNALEGHFDVHARSLDRGQNALQVVQDFQGLLFRRLRVHDFAIDFFHRPQNYRAWKLVPVFRVDALRTDPIRYVKPDFF